MAGKKNYYETRWEKVGKGNLDGSLPHFVLVVCILDVLCCFVKQWARLPELPAWYQSQYLQAEVLELSLDQPL